PGPPRTGAGRARRRRRARRGILWRYRRVWFLFGLLGFTALAGAIFVITQIPLPSEAPLAQTTLIFDAAGKPMAELHGVENRYPVSLDQVPEITQAAVIAAEDRKFLEHRGIDPMSIARATWADIRSKGVTQGGSTITQQYVKNQFVGSERSLVRKLKEAVIAIKLEQKYDKRTILEKYLNTVYFGRGAYGIQAAARTYFAKNVDQLDLKESAYLAGLIRKPSTGDVFVNPEDGYFLRSSVLTNMVRDAVITQEQADEVEQAKIEEYVFRPEKADTTFTNPRDGMEYFVEYVRQKLVDTYGEDRVLRGGLRVTTTLDPAVQAQAYRSVYGTLDRDDDPAGGLVALDMQGRVVAMVGGRDWAASKVNLAVGEEGGGSGRQGGSAFKPFVLAEAIRQGISVDKEYFDGSNKMKLQGWEHEVENYERASYPPMNLVEATAWSVNTVYAQLVNRVRPENVAKLAKDLGIRSELNAVPSIALGTQNVSVLDMATAYLTLANDGQRVDPRVIAKVEEGGTVLVDDKPANRRRVLPPDVARQVRSVLAEVVNRGSGVQAQLPNGGVWGKTGTSENYGDAWFVGGNEKLITAVWMGYPEGQSREMHYIHGITSVAGGTLPAFIFKRFMLQAAPGEGKPPTTDAVLDVRALNQLSAPWDPGPVSGPAVSASDSDAPTVVTTTTAPPAQPAATTVTTEPAVSQSPVASTPPPSTQSTTPVLTTPPVSFTPPTSPRRSTNTSISFPDFND
ncbi:MAG: transglycosylase domain-containing protein, partial [Actinomycetota bacterium]|nr:transglycosylase domain-containing protein [Actinomycetota bacterium]